MPSPPPVLRQTASKMLYFPSKLNCQLILMWKWRLSATQDAYTQTHRQTAFTPKHTDTNAEFRISPAQLLAAECGMHPGHKEVCAIWVCVVFCVCVRVCLCIALIKPGDTSPPISHMKVISEWRCCCGTLLNNTSQKNCLCVCNIFAAICAYYISVCDHIFFKWANVRERFAAVIARC